MPVSAYEFRFDGSSLDFDFIVGPKTFAYVYTGSTNQIAVPLLNSGLNVPRDIHREWVSRGTEFSDRIAEVFTVPNDPVEESITSSVTPDKITLSAMFGGELIVVSYELDNDRMRMEAFLAFAVSPQEWDVYNRMNRHLSNVADILRPLS